MLWLSVNFFQLPLDVFSFEASEGVKSEHLKSEQFKPELFNPEQSGAELAVVESGKVVFCNQAASGKGVEVGMKVSTAFALSDALRVKQRDFSLEKGTLTQLATVAYEFSSQVCLYNDKTILLEVAGSCKLFGDLSCLLNLLLNRLDSFSVDYFIGVGATPKAAYLLGLYEQLELIDLVSLSSEKLFDDFKCNINQRLELIPIDFLEQEPVSVLSIKVDKIKKMGIRRLGELTALSGGAVGRRFGKCFLNYLERLNGAISDPQMLFCLPDGFSMQRYFLSGLDTVEQLLFPAKLMLGELLAFLKIRRAMAVKIIWKMVCFDRSILRFDIELSSEVQTLEQFMMLTRLKLQDVILKEKIETVLLESDGFVTLQEKQKGLVLGDLFSDEGSAVDSNSDDSNSDEFDEMMDRLSVRLGTGCCSVLQVNDEYLPERVSVAKSGTLLSERKMKNKKQLSQPSTSSEKPLWLLDNPRPIFLASNNFNRERAVQLNYCGALSLTSKAEKIDNLWWGESQQRDYYKAEGPTGITYWVFYDRLNSQWFVQGFF